MPKRQNATSSTWQKEKPELARSVINSYSFTRIESHIDSNGMQPLEVVRGFSLHYSLYNIRAFFALATLAESLDIDLWNYKTKAGIGIKDALDYVIPYIGKQDEWPHKDLGRGEYKKWSMLLYQAIPKYKFAKYGIALKLSESSTTKSNRYYRLIVPQ